ncbi:MAG: flagellar assembly peptidoglycan hydrolase FlgJ [Immundisolibacteraceae bacterium]|nr:flagellar assembly peptidoglycan hydrolase FlgJ [Immundisolibacteraceae bacterium]
MDITSSKAIETGPRNLFDRQGIADLRRMTRAETPEAMAAVAQQFETLFVGMMLKSMRAASGGEDELFGSSAQQTYQGMFDQQLALQNADRGILGIGKLMLQQLQQRSPGEVQQDQPGATQLHQAERPVRRPDSAPSLSDSLTGVTGADSGMTEQGVAYRTLVNETSAQITSTLAAIELRAPGADIQTQRQASVVAVKSRNEPIVKPTAEQFVEQIWTLAVSTANRLGIAPEAIVGQAVLESGWGQKTIAHEDGRSSHNVFGIKAGSEWAGDSVTVSTLEYEQGIAIRQQAKFRAYDSYADAFADYADFLQHRNWYQPALAQGHNIDGFARGLQQAGYATDPNYASKITQLAMQIKQREEGG